ncbi:hypothetical protein NM688_g4018 [Phlebia brevispora]|uniref:Uncharacterized protein n=1 Tax=Phlebia brevispora TaxID=194682 RepID=A0ACC1T3U2_9APHY|nr:hypothetical protein NM688_g4018 [Phlebia brevispora]
MTQAEEDKNASQDGDREPDIRNTLVLTSETEDDEHLKRLMFYKCRDKNMPTNSAPPAEPFTDKTCPGCKKAIINDGSTVVAFGQSFFHVDCFKCAKCSNKVTADTNLLLLSDGSPVCSNCSYSCNICGQPILDEAIMTGEDSYHAHCFNCKVCKKRIEELVFAKTSTGIYCMDCHNARVARSKRHQERREREKRERERRTTEEAVANGVASDAGAIRTSETQARSTTNGCMFLHAQPLEPQPTPPTVAPLNPRSDARTNGQASTPRSSDFAPAAGAPVRQNTVSAPYKDGQPGPAAAVAANGYDHLRSSSTPITNIDTLSVPSDGMSKTMQKRKSFEDRPLNILLKDVSAPAETLNRQDSLLVPDSGTSRKEKRRSINPVLAMTYNNMSQKPSSQNSSTVSSPTTPNHPNPQTPPSQTREYRRVSSPLA